MLFAGYLALQIPSNLLLTRVRPSIYLPACMALWGVVSACTSQAKGFASLVVCRFFLGFLEAPFFPGALFLLSSWYTPRELATRTAIMYAGSLLSSAFGGLVGAGIQYGMDGAHGLRSWQWLFVIEGSATVAISLAAMFVLPDFPSNTRWLTAEERAVAVHRLRATSGYDEERGSLLEGLKLAVTDYKVWLLTAIVILKTTAEALSAFVPTLVGTFKFSKVDTLLMTAPPYVLAAIASLVLSYSSDRTGDRFWHQVAPLTVALVGFIIAASTHALASRYLALFLILGGTYGSFDITYAWLSSTIPHPVEKRSAAFAIANTVGNVAQIYSPYLYDQKYSPQYLSAMIADAVSVLAAIGAATALYFLLKRENRLLDEFEAIEAEAEAEDKVGKEGGRTRVLGQEPAFRYAL